MLNVCCVKVGTKYGPEYVNILFDMVRRNLKAGLEGKFVCFTDDPSGLDPGVEARSVPADLTGWWAKLYLFAPEAFPKGERILYFDLDVVITGSLDDICAYNGRFAVLEDFVDPTTFNSSIMAWRAGSLTHIWQWWNDADRPVPVGGDQEWIRECIGKHDVLQKLFPGAFRSYKLESLGRFPEAGTKVVIFHGEPKPDNCGRDWVSMIWKVGGGSGAELEVVCNTEDKRLHNNIRLSSERDIPWLNFEPAHEGTAVIVGGGPSLHNFLPEIALRAKNRHTIIAVNGSYNFLLNNGITPDWHVILDAQSKNISFLSNPQQQTDYLLASQVDPSLFEALKDFHVTLWHPGIPGVQESIPENSKPLVIISAGTTVGLAAMGIAFARGFRTIHVFGMDSSYTEAEHHAYLQSTNDSDSVLDVVCEGRSFKAAPWMVAQVNDFQVIAKELAEAGCVIHVHGDGLLPWVAKTIQELSEPDTNVVERDGVFWPSKDREGNIITPSELYEIPRILTYCKRKGTVIQAGGNVGLWPKELSKHFSRVITFEADPLNYRCLDLNCDGNQKIEHYNKALAESCGKVGVKRDIKNCGAHQIVDGKDIEAVTIDSLNVSECDLIQLDIEGYELNALRGAEATISKFKPVICLEIKGLGEAYGIKDEEVFSWLENRGYKHVDKIGRDYVFNAT